MTNDTMDAALSALGAGEVVAAPTESFYGLLADATRTDSVDRLFGIKPRSEGAALILPDEAAWRALVTDIPELARKLARAFWPGPLTIVLNAVPSVDPRLTVSGTVGARLPGPSPAADLARAFGRPLTATSANPHGEPPATSGEQVESAFGRSIADGKLFVVRGSCPGGLPSTLVRVEKAGFSVIRQGAIAEADIRAACGGGL